MKAWFIIFLVFLFTSCEGFLNYMEEVDDETTDQSIEDTYCHMPLYFGDFSDIDTINDISDWLQYQIDYRYCGEVYTPEQVLTQGFGDCDGFALCWINIAFIRFGVKASLVMVDGDEARKIVKGGDVSHAIVQLPNGVQIDPQTGWVCDYPIRYIYSFNTVFDRKIP